jgi:hypothetical protein
MDDNRFDSLTRALGSGRSRRGVLKTLGAAALGAIGLTTVGEAAAAPPASKPSKPSKCYGDHSSCTNGKQCCSGTCTNRTCAPAVPVDLCAGKTCDDGNECTTDSCSGGVCSHNPTSGAPCNGGLGTCDPSGTCKPGVACGPAMSCPPPSSSCQINSCDVGTSICIIYNVAKDTICDSGAGTCDGAGTCVYPVDPCAGITCTPKSECLGAYCDQGQCFDKAYGAGTPCSSGICDGKGACISDPCAGVVCTPNSDCTTSTCVQGACDNKPKPTGTPCSIGTCDATGTCQPPATCGGTCDAMFPCPMNCMCSGGVCV